MGLFRRKRAPLDAPPAPTQRAYAPVTLGSQFYLGYGGAAHVTTQQAMRTAAVAACVRVLKTAIAGLPVDEVIVQGQTRTPVQPSKIVATPSGRVTRRNWVAQMADSLIGAGNAYGQIVAYDGALRPTQIETIAADDVKWRKYDGVLTPYVDNKPRDIWPLGDLIHVPASAFLRAGCPVADSPVELAAESISTALAAERFGAGFFTDGGHPSAVIYSDQELDTAGAKNVKNSVLGAMNGREPAVLGSGLKYEQIQVDPKDSQFIDLLQFEILQACRFFGVPPTMVYAAITGQNITYANVAESDLQFLKYSVSIWLADLEDAWSSWITAPRVVKFNVNALLRMDAKSRHELYDLRLRNKTLSVNDVHRLEDEKPVSDPAFDEPGIPGGEASSLPPPPPPPGQE